MRRRRVGRFRSSCSNRSQTDASDGGERRRVQQRYERLPAGAKDGDQRGRRDQQRRSRRRAAASARRSRPASSRSSSAPSTRHGVFSSRTNAPSGRSSSDASRRSCARVRGIDALGVELRVDRVGSDLAGMELAPDREQAVIVLAAAECAGSMPGGERGHLVEKEQLREATGLQERVAMPVRGTGAGTRSSACRCSVGGSARSRRGGNLGFRRRDRAPGLPPTR